MDRPLLTGYWLFNEINGQAIISLVSTQISSYKDACSFHGRNYDRNADCFSALIDF